MINKRSMLYTSIGCILMMMLAIPSSDADDILDATGFSIGSDGWSRGSAEEEKEVGGWIFHNRPTGQTTDADTTLVILTDFIDVADDEEKASFLNLLRNQNQKDYAKIRFQPFKIDGQVVEMAIALDENGDTNFDLTVPVKNRLWNLFAVKTGQHDQIPADLKNLLESIRLKGETKPKPRAIESDGLATISLVFRDRAARGFEKAVNLFNGDKAFQFMLDGSNYRDNSDAWSMLIDGSYMMHSAPGQPQPVTCFYHPLLDAALLIRWTQGPGQTVYIEKAAVVTGSWKTSLQNGAPFVPGWLTDTVDPYTAMQQRTASFVQSFEQQYPPQQTETLPFPDQTSADLVESLFMQCRTQMETLIALQSPELKPVRECLNEFRLALNAGDLKKLASIIPSDNPVQGSLLTGLPMKWRSHLTPVFVMPGKEQIVVLLGTDDTPGFYLIVNIRKGPRPVIDSVGMTCPDERKGSAS